jgi:hypothetical protein
MIKKLVYLTLLIIFNFVFLFLVYEGHTQSTISLPMTGQKKCYNSSGAETPCAGTGQDGEIRGGMEWPKPRFTASGDCVNDNLTGLMWAKNANLPNSSKTWQEALDYVASINSGSGLCGYKDWRLPNINELVSLLNFGETGNKSTWLTSQGFSNVQGSQYHSGSGFSNYWSSTTMEDYMALPPVRPEYAWTVGMRHGAVRFYSKSDLYFVWPVRSGK